MRAEGQAFGLPHRTGCSRVSKVESKAPQRCSQPSPSQHGQIKVAVGSVSRIAGAHRTLTIDAPAAKSVLVLLQRLPDRLAWRLLQWSDIPEVFKG